MKRIRLFPNTSKIAYDMLKNLGIPTGARDPYCHHENGMERAIRALKGQIPFSARLFAVVDVYDSMTTNRRTAPQCPARMSFLFEISEGAAFRAENRRCLPEVLIDAD